LRLPREDAQAARPCRPTASGKAAREDYGSFRVGENCGGGQGVVVFHQNGSIEIAITLPSREEGQRRFKDTAAPDPPKTQ